jgi:uncharacterized membrane protein YgcG
MRNHAGATLLLLATLAAAVAHAMSSAKMVCLVNRERARRGLSALGLDSRLDKASRWHSEDQADMRSMTHNGSDGSDPGARVEEAGFEWTAVAENVAYGYDTEEDVLDEWMNSSGHRANILGKSYTHMGFASAYASDGTAYITQDFASDGGYASFPECPQGYEESSGQQSRGHSPSSSSGGYNGGRSGGRQASRYVSPEEDDRYAYYDDETGRYSRYNPDSVVTYDDESDYDPDCPPDQYETEWVYDDEINYDDGDWEYQDDNGDWFQWRRR